jgi:hypothetical protein
MLRECEVIQRSGLYAILRCIDIEFSCVESRVRRKPQARFGGELVISFNWVAILPNYGDARAYRWIWKLVRSNFNWRSRHGFCALFRAIATTLDGNKDGFLRDS